MRSAQGVEVIGCDLKLGIEERPIDVGGDQANLARIRALGFELQGLDSVVHFFIVTYRFSAAVMDQESLTRGVQRSPG